MASILLPNILVVQFLYQVREEGDKGDNSSDMLSPKLAQVKEML